MDFWKDIKSGLQQLFSGASSEQSSASSENTQANNNHEKITGICETYWQDKVESILFETEDNYKQRLEALAEFSQDDSLST